MAHVETIFWKTFLVLCKWLCHWKFKARIWYDNRLPKKIILNWNCRLDKTAQQRFRVLLKQISTSKKICVYIRRLIKKSSKMLSRWNANISESEHLKKQLPHHNIVDLCWIYTVFKSNHILSRKVILILHVVAQFTLEQRIWLIIIALKANPWFFFG